jgi:hypothetical protein
MLIVGYCGCALAAGSIRHERPMDDLGGIAPDISPLAARLIVVRL